jgi:L-2-hydroxyglutarate oxidase LhgO
MHILVVGAGVVGLAVARQAALAGHEVTLAEAAGAIGTGTSSRNSEVIHAGLYYPTHSLRALHCVRGRHMLYDFCRSHGIPHRRLGKLLVVTETEDIPVLEALYAQATLNGVENLQMLTAKEAIAMEPELACVAAFHSPETGIIDTHRYMLALQGDAEDRGGRVALRTPVERITRDRTQWMVHFGGAEPGGIVVDGVVNAAGHGAQRLALATEDYPAGRVPRHVMAKGNYFKFTRKAAFSRLIYPAPVPGGLGIHVTLDLGGAMRFGPDVEWIEEENYDVDPRRAEAFHGYIRKYFPRLPPDSLVPDYAGIRPKLTGKGEAPVDFVIDTPEQHGIPGLVHLFGIESPGLTSSLSIGEAVVASLSEKS